MEMLKSILLEYLQEKPSIILSHTFLSRMSSRNYNHYFVPTIATRLVEYQSGAVHKVRHAQGGVGPRRCDSLCQWGEGIKSMWRHAFTNCYLTYETWNLKWCLTFCCNRCIVTEGGTNKNQPGQNPRTKTSANNWDRICTGDFCPEFLY